MGDRVGNDDIFQLCSIFNLRYIEGSELKLTSTSVARYAAQAR